MSDFIDNLAIDIKSRINELENELSITKNLYKNIKPTRGNKKNPDINIVENVGSEYAFPVTITSGTNLLEPVKLAPKKKKRASKKIKRRRPGRPKGSKNKTPSRAKTK